MKMMEMIGFGIYSKVSSDIILKKTKNEINFKKLINNNLLFFLINSNMKKNINFAAPKEF